MHRHHSTTRLFWGFIVLMLVGLAGYIVFLYADARNAQSSASNMPAAYVNLPSAATSSEPVPGLVSDTPPPGPSTTTPGHAFAR